MQSTAKDSFHYRYICRLQSQFINGLLVIHQSFKSSYSYSTFHRFSLFYFHSFFSSTIHARMQSSSREFLNITTYTERNIYPVSTKKKYKSTFMTFSFDLDVNVFCRFSGNSLFLASHMNHCL